MWLFDAHEFVATMGGDCLELKSKGRFPSSNGRAFQGHHGDMEQADIVADTNENLLTIIDPCIAFL